ncbi:hypothetical protein KEM54_006412 [Ascosphaera aggregata]|nr:hypothetical protein KEM54_006412 [Ascosphaera aggregata]
MATATLTTTLHPTQTPSRHPIRLSPAPSRIQTRSDLAAGTEVASQNDVDGPRQPRLRITARQKQALIDNLQLEITERARNLRAQYSLQTTDLRSRIERRINRIPLALRKVKMGELLAKHEEQQTQDSTTSSSSTSSQPQDSSDQQPEQNEKTAQNQSRAPVPADVPIVKKKVPGYASGSGMNRNGRDPVRKVSKRHLSPEKDAHGSGAGIGGVQHGGSKPTRVVKKKKGNNPSAAVLSTPSQTQAHVSAQTHADNKENQPHFDEDAAVHSELRQPSPVKNSRRRRSAEQLAAPKSPFRQVRNAGGQPHHHDDGHDHQPKKQQHQRQQRQEHHAPDESRVLTPKSSNSRAYPVMNRSKQTAVNKSPTKKANPTPTRTTTTLAVRGPAHNNGAGTSKSTSRPMTSMGISSGTSPLKSKRHGQY